MHRRLTLIEGTLSDLLLNRLQALAQLQRQAERLSIELAALKQQITEAAHVAAPIEKLHGQETIFIADDDSLVRSIAQEILEGFGYHILLAKKDWHGTMATSPIDLALLDVPLLNEYYLERLKRTKESSATARLIVCTPLPEGPARNHLRAWGVDGFVSKPYQPLALARCVRQVLDMQIAH